MYNFDSKAITALVLISSESCNLNCEYCEIAKSANQYYNKEQAKLVKESYTNGVFLNNIKNIFSKLEIEPNNITQLDLWGQEPTLTLDGFNYIFPELYNLLPNINRLMFSTNMVQYYEKILNLIDILEKEIPFNKKILLDIQVSFDGYENTLLFRKINPDIILNNLENLIRQINEKKLEKVDVHFHFNTVLTAKECEEKLNNKEAIKKYWLDLDDLTKRYNLIITNPSLRFRRYNGIGLEAPVHASQSQGKALAYFLKASKELYEENHDPRLKGFEQLVYKLLRPLDVVYNEYDNYYDFLKKLTHYDIDKNFVEKISRSMYCGNGVGALKVRYDGTLVHCHNVIHHITPESLKNKQGWEYRNLEQFAKHKYYPNILTDSKEDFDKYIYQANVIQKSAYPFNYSLTVNLMRMLRDAGQLHECYNNNDELLLKHALIAVRIGTCWDGNVKYLGSGVGNWVGSIRFICNGALNYLVDYEEEFIKNQIEQRKERRKKKEERKNG